MTEECNQQNCGEEAVKHVYWPGKEQPLPMCYRHAEKARGIAGALGMLLSVQDIQEPAKQSRG